MTLHISLFTKSPDEVQAVHVPETDDDLQLLNDIANWCNGVVFYWQERGRTILLGEDLRNRDEAALGDWIIRDADGTFSTCPHEKFWAEHTYIGDVVDPGTKALFDFVDAGYLDDDLGISLVATG